MSHDKEMKAVSPLLQQAINISSIIGGVGTLIFCIWAYQAGILHSKETLSDIRCRCLYLRAYRGDDLQLYWHCYWLRHYLLLGASLRSPLCSVCPQQADL